MVRWSTKLEKLANMADRTIAINLDLKATGDAEKKAQQLANTLTNMETGSLKKVVTQMGDLAKNTEDARKRMERLQAEANKTREQMEKLAQVGSRIAMLGGAILAPQLLALKKYADKYKETEPLAMRLLQANQKIERAVDKWGRVIADTVVPGLEKAADVAMKIADFVEANPAIAKAALNIGALLTVAGGLITAAAQIGGTIATIKGLQAAGGAAAGVGGAAGTLGNVTILASAVILGAGVGEALGNAINRAIGQSEYDPFTAIKQLAAIATTDLAASLARFGAITDDSAEKIRQAALRFLGLGGQIGGKGVTDTAGGTGGQVKSASNELFRLADAARKTKEESEAAAAAIDKAGSSFSSLQSQIAALALQIKEREQQRASERQRIIDQANKEMERAAEDHRRNLEAIERRRLKNVADAAQLRDAPAIDRANEQADIEKAEAEESFRIAQRRRQADLKDQLRYFDAETRAQREQDLRKLAELQAAAAAEMQIIQNLSAARLQLLTQELAAVQQMGAGLGPISGGNIPAPSVPTPGADRLNQTVNIQMSTGQTMAQIRREISSAQRNLARSFDNALGTI